MKFALTTIAWLETLARKEIEKLWWIHLEVKDRIIFFEWPEELIPRVNLWSRIWNKLYLVAWEKKEITTFDLLFDMISKVNWKKYITDSFPILVNAKSVRSLLTSLPTVQSISKKAIIFSLTWEKDKFVRENEDLQPFDIITLLFENTGYVLLNTSWEALHKRWYRRKTGDAPIKENLAAALVLLSSWRFKDSLYDPFCWSWTILIEALMIAKNIAPWLQRTFAFEKRKFLNSELLEKEKQIAKSKIYTWKYKIFWSDKDLDMVNIAKQNAKNAWLWDEIVFECKDFSTFSKEVKNGWVVSNPPYGKRLVEEDIDSLYDSINLFYRNNQDIYGWIITSYEEFQYKAEREIFKNRKLYNGNELCYFYYKNWTK